MARAKLWFKVTSAIFLLAVLGSGAALVALKALFPEPKARAYVVEAARKQLGREVRLDHIDIGLTGLHLKGLQVSERPDFAAGTFVSVETFSLRPSWKALLRRKLVVQTASADGLKLRVVKNEDGSFNYDTLASSAPATPAPAKAAGADEPAPEFNVRHLRVTRGDVDYRDLSSGASWAVSELALKLDDFSLSEPFDLDLSLRAKGKAGVRPVDAQLAFSGTVSPARGHREKFALDFKRLSAEQDGLKLTAKGSVAGLDAPSAKLDATLSAAGKTLLELKGTVRAGAAPAEGARRIDADLSFNTPGLDTTLIAKWAPSAGVPALALPATDGSFEGLYFDGATAGAKAVRAAWKGGEIAGSFMVRGLGTEKMFYGGNAKFGLDLPEIRAGQYSFIKLPPKAVVPAMRLDGAATYGADGELTLTSLAARFKQGTASAAGAVHKIGSNKPVADLALKFAVDVPSFKINELPVTVSALPADFVVPAMRLDGGARIHGDDVSFDKVAVKGKSGTLRLDGNVLKALAGAPEPALEIGADLDLPALTDKDLPFPGVPAGLELPASKWNADLTYTPKLIKLRTLGLKIGSNEITAEGGVVDPSGRGAFDLLFKCRKFVLEELTRMTPRTRDLKLAGAGFFALSVTGTKEKPVFGGKLQFEGLGATVAELPLSQFKGTVSFNETRIDVPNLKGMVADGNLAMDLTLKDYAKNPEIQVEASLDRFDLGKYFDAKKKLEADAQASKAAKEAAGKPAEKKASTPIRTRGSFKIAALVHPNAQLQTVAASWDLWGVTPEMTKLNGDAKISSGEGRLRDVGKIALQSPILKILLFPILIVQKISFGVNLNDIAVGTFSGDYGFKDGLMTVRHSVLDAGKAADFSTEGTVDLPAERLDLVVGARIGNIPRIETGVTGTMSDPKAKLKVGKLLETAGQNLLNGLLKR